MAPLHLLKFVNLPIFDQLILEEKLLRACDKNYCLINIGTPKSIVLGISGKPEELVNTQKAKAQNVPLIKRFSGGGTVIVDENTLFISFIFNNNTFDFAPFPEKIHSFAESLYTQTFEKLPFALKENDYIIGDKKCGGNAQYIKKNRWLHHTSFLWDFEKANMDLLLHPKKTPKYRDERPHTEFLCTLKEFFSSKEIFLKKVENGLRNRFCVEELAFTSLSILEPDRIATHYIKDLP